MHSRFVVFKYQVNVSRIQFECGKMISASKYGQSEEEVNLGIHRGGTTNGRQHQGENMKYGRMISINQFLPSSFHVSD